LTLLAIVFTVALAFATIELPRALNRFVDAALGIAHLHPVMEPDLIEAFMRSSHVRLIGYSCLAVVVVLILAGFVTERTALSSLGAIALFPPTFGYSAVYVFFLAGLGILRAVPAKCAITWLRCGTHSSLLVLVSRLKWNPKAVLAPTWQSRGMTTLPWWR
jgi:hypothetical protein